MAKDVSSEYYHLNHANKGWPARSPKLTVTTVTVQTGCTHDRACCRSTLVHSSLGTRQRLRCLLVAIQMPVFVVPWDAFCTAAASDMYDTALGALRAC